MAHITNIRYCFQGVISSIYSFCVVILIYHYNTSYTTSSVHIHAGVAQVGLFMAWVGVFERFGLCKSLGVVIFNLYYYANTTSCFIHHVLYIRLYILRLFLPLRCRRSSLTAVALGLAFSWLGFDVFERFGLCKSLGVVIFNLYYYANTTHAIQHHSSS